MFPGPGGKLYRTPRGDFGPRVGPAYRVTDEWVVRSGFGVTYLPSNTGYFGGPYYFGAQNFFPRTSNPVALQYGQNPQGRLLVPYNQSATLIPLIGANPNAPQYYGSGANEPRFNFDTMQNGKVLQWNFFIERKLGRDWLTQVGYSGTQGYRLQMGRFAVNHDQDLPQSLLDQWRNQYVASNGTNPGTLTVANPFQPDLNNLIPFNGSLGTRSMAVRDTLIPYPFFSGNLVGSPIGYQRYNAFMAQVQKSYSNGLLFNAHYTWSKAIDMWGSEAQNNNFAENAGLQTGSIDRRNLRNSYFISPNDIPHRFVGTVLWSPPFGKGRKWGSDSKLLNRAMGGWNLGTVIISQSGQPQQCFGGSGGSMLGLGDSLRCARRSAKGNARLVYRCHAGPAYRHSAERPPGYSLPLLRPEVLKRRLLGTHCTVPQRQLRQRYLLVRNRGPALHRHPRQRPV